MPHAVKLENICVRFRRGVEVFDGFSAQFATGSFTALVGPSGCGKSTLLRLIAGLLQPCSGTLSTMAGQIGFVFQEPTLLAWRSVRDNIVLPLRMQGASSAEIKSRTDEALSLVGLSERADAVPRELSGGMKMRVSLARALAQQPDVLLMDEPFGALDELTRQRLDDDLLAIWRQYKCTVLFVTHSLSEAAYLAEHVLVMRADGRLADTITIDKADTPTDFRASPAYHAAYRAIASGLGHEPGVL